MSLVSFFPSSTCLYVQQVHSHEDRVTFEAQTTSASAVYPDCGHRSQRIHSRYVRTLKDVAYGTQSTCLLLRCRRFFCDSAECARKTFSERLPDLAAPYAHTTQRLDEAHQAIGLALGGEAGARLAARLHLPTSPDTLLRRIRRLSLPMPSAPTMVGIDD